jgi:glycosyltransferase involved in cell wall biosynthesis
MALLARARLSVTPVANQTTASGQITFVNAMRLGVPVIATRCPGTEGYVEDGRTGLLVPPGDAAALAGAIGRLWDDARARETLSGAARAEAEASFSDEAAAAWLGAMIGELRGRPPLASQHRTSHNSA